MKNSSYLRYLEWGLRIVIGGVFIYAAWTKRDGGIDFADSVASFQILPNLLVNPFAMAIPPFEMIAGLMALVGWKARVGVLGLLAMSSTYCIAITSALARGITVNCGCFGVSLVGTDPKVDLARDLLLVVGCALLYWLRIPRGSITTERKFDT